MNYLSVENLSKTFGDREILNGISFGVDQGQKVALVGVNGSGKSTLLKIIAGTETPDKGAIVFRNGIVVRSLLQNPQFAPGQNILDAVFNADDETLQLIGQYQQCLLNTTENQHDTARLQSLIEKIDNLNAWDMESQVKQILGKLGINDLDQNVATLSGGQQKRVALAQVLLQKPDLLILDEPTNHLDIETIEWLENYLGQQQMALILVTHDRYFLEKVTNEIFELENGEIFRYKGDYKHFLEKKTERIAASDQEITKAKNLYRKELEWIRRMPKARGTKAKYRVDNFEVTKTKAFSGKKEQKLELQAQSQRQGKKVLEVHQMSHRFDEKALIKNFSYTFQRKERVGITGPNGSGKTSFINLLTGQLRPTSGEVVKGETTQFGYYKQEELSFNENQTVIDFAKEIAEVVAVGNGQSIPVSQFLTRFLFPPEVQYKPIGKLSGGEKRRLQLLKVLIKNPNFLILDEPTNDLDLVTLNTLETYLESFDGCLILVSHDRYFMDKLVDHLFVFDGSGTIRDFPGNYTDFRNTKANPKPTNTPIPKTTKETKREPKESKRLSFKEMKEFEQLEKEIDELEAKKTSLIDQLNKGSENHEDLQRWSEEIKDITKTLDEKEMRWLELSEIEN